MIRRPFVTGRPATRLVWLLAAAVAGSTLVGCGATPAAPTRHLLIVLDGLRPDYITPEVMPALHTLSRRGVVFNRHHSVFPTVTRVNSSSISTGAYPETHGLMGNSVFFPQVDPARFLNTGEREVLLEISAAVDGHLLTAPTLAETLDAAGKRTLVISDGGTGSSFLLNSTLAGGGNILHTSYATPESLLADERAALGPLPADGTENPGAHNRTVDAFLKVGIPRVDPTVTLMWLGDPDHTAHAHGIGDPVTIDALKRVDTAIKRLEEGLKAAGLFDSYNIWVTSDHGFSTHTGRPDLNAILKPFAGTLPDGSPRIVADGGAIYVRDQDKSTITAMVMALQRTPGFGAVFTKAAQAGSMDGWVPGTLSFDAAHWNHARSADILVSPDWTDAANAHGMRGTTASSGVAGHGSTSPFDIHNTLVAAGPDIRQGVTIENPSGNVDFAPTFLRQLGIAIPQSMQGRVLDEAFRDGVDPASITVQPSEHEVKTADDAYVLTGSFSTVEVNGTRYRYFDRTTVKRAVTTETTRR